MQDSYLKPFFFFLRFNIHIHYFISRFELSDRPSFIHPKIDEFRGIPRYRVNSVFMNGLSHPVRVFSRKPYDPRNASTLQNISVCPVCLF